MKKELALACREKTLRILRILDQIIQNNTPVRRACVKENIDYIWFLRYAAQNHDQKSPKERGGARITKDDWGCWQEDFLRDLTGEETPAPDHFDEVFEKITREELRQNEYDVLHMRYVDGLTLRDTGEKLSTSQEHVRQIQSKALRKLRHPRLRYPLCYGKEYIEAKEDLRTAQAEYDAIYEKKENEIRQLSYEKIQELKERAAALKTQTEKLLDISAEELFMSEYERKLAETSLDELGLSVRSYNALNKYLMYKGVDRTAANVADLAGHLNEVRNIGQLCIKEISDVMMKRFSIDMCPQKH